jgi:rhamnosyltransferase
MSDASAARRPAPAPSVSAIIPTLNGAATLPALLAALRRVEPPVEIVAIDSGSRDGTLALLQDAGATILDLGGRPFGHGTARNRAIAAARGEVVLLLTQDVEPVAGDWLGPLLAALGEPHVAGAFGRQLPRGASPQEEFLADTNYGPAPRRVTAADVARFGPGATLFSSAFGAMTREAWSAVPLPDVVMSEDQAWARAVLEAGWELRYVPAAAVHHGHRFTLGRAFRRNFDSGSSLARLGLGGGAWRPGVAHLARELGWIRSRYGAAALPGTLLYESVRMAGFQLGRLEPLLPRGLARLLGEAPRP